MSFVLPDYSLRAAQMWGPEPAEQDDTAVQRVYSKSERICRLADWQYLTEEELKLVAAKNKKGFQEVKNEGEIKEIKKVNKEKQGPTPFAAGQGGGRGGHGQGGRGGGAQQGRGGHQQGGRGGQRRPWAPREPIFRIPTLKLGDELKIEPIHLSAILKSPEVEATSLGDFAVQGTMRQFNDDLDHSKQKKPTRMTEGGAPYVYDDFFNDQVVRKFVAENPGKRIVVATDTVVSKLMTAHKTVNSWDVAVRTNGMVIFLSERTSTIGNLANSDSRLDFEWVNESSRYNAPREETSNPAAVAMNLAVPLAKENADASRAFRAMAKKKKMFPWKGAQKSKYETNSLFRYRHWVVNPNTPEEFLMIVRCEIDAAVEQPNKEPQLAKLFTMLEGPQQENHKPWRGLPQPATILITSIENNAAKLAQWATLALLADADVMKIACASRVSALDNQAHEILHVETRPVREFAGQLQVSLKKLLGFLSYIVHSVLRFAGDIKSLETFYVMRDPKNERLLIIDPTTSAAHDASSSEDDSSDDDSSDDDSTDDSSSSSDSD